MLLLGKNRIIVSLGFLLNNAQFNRTKDMSFAVGNLKIIIF